MILVCISLRSLTINDLNFKPNPFIQHLPKLWQNELRCVAQAVGRVSSETGTEDVLDTLFKGFCIGKGDCVGQWGSATKTNAYGLNWNKNGIVARL